MQRAKPRQGARISESFDVKDLRIVDGPIESTPLSVNQSLPVSLIKAGARNRNSLENTDEEASMEGVCCLIKTLISAPSHDRSAKGGEVTI